MSNFPLDFSYDPSYTPTEDDIAAYNEDRAKRDGEAKVSTLPKPVRRTIAIFKHSGDTEQIDNCEVYAGVLAVRKLPKSRDYNITHVPTGMSIIDYTSPKTKALECIIALLEDGAKIWQFGELGDAGNAGDAIACFKICQRVANKARHIAHPENWNEDGTRVRR